MHASHFPLLLTVPALQTQAPLDPFAAEATLFIFVEETYSLNPQEVAWFLQIPSRPTDKGGGQVQFPKSSETKKLAHTHWLTSFFTLLLAHSMQSVSVGPEQVRQSWWHLSHFKDTPLSI